MARFLFITQPFVIDPLGIAYLSASLKQDKNNEVELLLTSDKDIKFKMAAFFPDFVCYSATTGNHKYYLEFNRKLKSALPFNYMSLFGGPHCTYFPEIIDERGVDLICVGDGEDAIRELARKCPIDLHDVKVKNIYTKFCKNKVAATVNVESYKPDRSLIYTYKQNLNNPIKNAMTMRGCAFNCPYCYNYQYHKLFGNKVRFYDVDNTIQDLRELKCAWNAKFIWFEDDMFICNLQRLKIFLEKYKQKVSLPYHCQVRAELMTDNIALLLKSSGCKSVTFAIESGNDNIRINLLERKMSKEQILNCCGILKKYNILYRTENMIGLPGETFKQAIETLDFNIETKPDAPWCSVYQPYPRTKLGEISGFTGAEGFNGDFFTTSPLKTKYRKQFDRLQKLFALAVHYKLVRKLIPILIYLPLDKIYKRISTWYKYKTYDTKLYKYQ